MPQPLIHITRKSAFIFAGFLVLYEFLTYIANDMIMPGMLHVVKSFHAPESAIANSFTAYILGGASLQLFLGPLSDRYGRRPVMLFGAFFFLLSTLFIALSQSMDQFLVARFFQGMGLCFICVVGYATLQEIFAEMDAIRLIAIMANVAILAPLLGPLVGAVFIRFFSWRLIFVIIAALAFTALWGLWRFMPESVGAARRNGELLKAVSLSPRVIAANYKALLLNRPFMLGSLSLGLLSLPCCLWIAFAPVILVLDAKLSIIQYGVWQLPVFGGYILGNILLQKLTHRNNITQLACLGSLISVVGLLGMFILPWLIFDNYFWLMPGLIVYSFGYGVVGAPLNRFILYSTAVGKGTGSALLSMLSMAVMGFGTELVNFMDISHDPRAFGFGCALIGLVHFIFLSGTFFYSRLKQ